MHGSAFAYRMILVFAWLALSSAACDGSRKLPNVVLVSIDTLRADALEVYGYDRATSPRLNAFAKQSYVFGNAFTQSPNTIVSHASMLTGLYPRTHGTRRDRPLAGVHTTLAEVLRDDLGFRTGGFATHADWLTREKGFAQGFDRFESKYRDASSNTEAALHWLDSWVTRGSRMRGASVFLFLHYYDVHSDWNERPYESEARFAELYEGKAAGNFSGCRYEVCASRLLRRANVETGLLSSEEVEWIRALYDAGVATMDAELGALFEALDRRDLFDTSWIVVTSDHGEEFREHGRMLHSQAYRETAQVPLIIRPPGGIERMDIEATVGLVDILPTILAVLGATPTSRNDGRSLVAMMEGASASERLLPFDFYHEANDFAARNARFSLISRRGQGGVELYDLTQDPDERENVASRFPAIAQKLQSEARALREQHVTPHIDAVDPHGVSEAEQDRLRALGYLD